MVSAHELTTALLDPLAANPNFAKVKLNVDATLLPSSFVLLHSFLHRDDFSAWLNSCRATAYVRGLSLRSLMSLPLLVLVDAAEEMDRQRRVMQHETEQSDKHWCLEQSLVAGEEFGWLPDNRFAVRHYDFGDLPLRIFEFDPVHSADDDTMPIGSAQWPAGDLMCKYLAVSGAEIIRPEHRVLELGAGVGALSIIAASVSQAHVLATDHSEACLQIIRINMELNRKEVGNLMSTSQAAGSAVNGAVEAAVLNFGDSGFLVDGHGYDVILAADVVYSERVVDPLMITITKVLADKGVLLLGHCSRDPVIDQALFEAAAKHGLSWVDLTPTLPDFGLEGDPTPKVFQFSRSIGAN